MGLATANTIAAVTAGAQSVEVSVNGICGGDEAGLASLEETTVALETLYGITTGIRMEKLYDLSKFVLEKTGLKLGYNKPIVGEDAGFLHEVDADVAQLLSGTYSPSRHPFPPELVGQKDGVVFTKQTLLGGALRAKLNQLGLEYDEKDLAKIIKTIKSKLETRNQYPVWMTESEVEEICHDVVRQTIV